MKLSMRVPAQPPITIHHSETFGIFKLFLLKTISMSSKHNDQ